MRPTDAHNTPLLSTRVPLGRTHTPAARQPAEDGAPPNGRAASAPAIFDPSLARSGAAAAAAAADRDIFSPQPLKAQAVQFSLPFPPSNEASRASSPAAPVSPKHAETGVPSNHNLPWTKVERGRLVELMRVYPEEEVHARRHAKIAAAMGTRTASQVSNRISKLQARWRRQRKGRLDEQVDPGDEVDSLAVDGEVRATAEYQEYVRLRRQVEALERSPELPVHEGFRCDACSMEPIVGTRWRCVKCHEPAAVDLCDDCHRAGRFATATHRTTHRLIRQEM